MAKRLVQRVKLVVDVCATTVAIVLVKSTEDAELVGNCGLKRMDFLEEGKLGFVDIHSRDFVDVICLIASVLCLTKVEIRLPLSNIFF